MKIAEIRGDECLDVLADIFEPVALIMADSQLKAMAKEKATVAKIASYILKRHKEETIQVLAALDGRSVEEYKETMNLLTLPRQLVEIINDPDLKSLFINAAQTKGANSSDAASANATAGA